MSKDGDINTQVNHYANKLTFLFLTDNDFEQKITQRIVELGQQVAMVSYKSWKSGNIDKITEAKDTAKLTLSSEHPGVMNGNIWFYFDFCRFYGTELSKGTPEEIDKMIDSLLHIKKN